MGIQSNECGSCPIWLAYGEVEQLDTQEKLDAACRKYGCDLMDKEYLSSEKLPKEFLRYVDQYYNGLKTKYLVYKADTGERLDNCFILRPDKDRAAVFALRAYAESTDNGVLSEDIYNWVGKDDTSEENNICAFCCDDEDFRAMKHSYDDSDGMFNYCPFCGRRLTPPRLDICESSEQA